MNRTNLKHLFLNSLFLICVTVTLFAQKKGPKVKFGKLSEEEIKMTSYKEDTEAAAVVLFDKGSIYYSYINNDWVQIQERHKRIKIFKKEAYDYANIVVPLYGDEKIEDIKGITYNIENDKVVETKLSNDNIFTEQLAKRIAIKKINMPSVREGSIIDIKYTIRDNNAIYIPEWRFQDLIPTQWSEFEANVPDFVTYRKMGFGQEAFVINENKTEVASFSVTFRTRSDGFVTTSEVQNEKVRYTNNIMHYAQEKVPALKLEKYCPSPKNYLSRIIFEISAVYNTDFNYMGGEYVMTNKLPRTNTFTWSAIAKEMYKESFEDWIENNKNVDEVVINSAKSKPTDKEKLQTIIDYFDKNFQCGTYHSAFPSQTPKECISKHKGSATDINLLFISYLKKVGLKTAPVMISTKGHGKIITFYPNFFAFDKVITCVTLDEKETLIDASTLKLPIGLIPMEDLNGEGLLMTDESNTKWINLDNKILTRLVTSSILEIKKDGTLNGAVNVTNTGYFANKLREEYKQGNEEALFKGILKDMAEETTILNKTLENVDKWQESNMKTIFDVTSSAYINAAGDKIYLSPLLSFPDNEHKFKETERKLDIDLPFPCEHILNYTYMIPEGYKIESLPKSMKVTLDDSVLSFDYILDASSQNQIKINIKYKQKKTYFQAEEYGDLREFYNKVIAKLGEQVVLTK